MNAEMEASQLKRVTETLARFHSGNSDVNRRTKEEKETASQGVAVRAVAAGDSEIAKVVKNQCPRTRRKEPSYSTEISRTIGSKQAIKTLVSYPIILLIVNSIIANERLNEDLDNYFKKNASEVVGAAAADKEVAKVAEEKKE